MGETEADRDCWKFRERRRDGDQLGARRGLLRRLHPQARHDRDLEGEARRVVCRAVILLARTPPFRSRLPRRGLLASCSLRYTLWTRVSRFVRFLVSLQAASSDLGPFFCSIAPFVIDKIEV